MQTLDVQNIHFCFSNNFVSDKKDQRLINKVIANFSLQAKQGDIVAILGRSGSGKSTLLRIIAGLLEPQEGMVLLDAQEFNQRLGKVGYMPQQDLLLPWLNVANNIAIPLRIQKHSKIQALSIAFSLLKKFDLFEYHKAYPQTLSGGMRQRISLLRSLVCHNTILVLDEPFSHLDYFNRYECLAWAKHVLRSVASIVFYVSHDIDEAFAFATRILVVSKQTMKTIYDVSLANVKNVSQVKSTIISLLNQDR